MFKNIYILILASIYVFINLSCSFSSYKWQDRYNEISQLNISEKLDYKNSPFNKIIQSSFSNSENNNNLHHVNILNTGGEALLARIHLIRNAQKSILIQTYILRNDETTHFIVTELLKSAERGVKIKIIDDQFASSSDIKLINYLAHVHPNIEFRLYNPSSKKVKPSALQLIGNLSFRFRELNQRMHNKIFIMDDRIAITGGRNIENDYFDRSKSRNFKDRDILVIGPIVQEMTRSFAQYWSFKLTFSAHDLIDVKKIKSKERLMDEFKNKSTQSKDLFKNLDFNASNFEHMNDKFVTQAFKIDQIEFIADEPGKSHRGFKGVGNTSQALSELIADAKKSIIIQTPYLVLDKYKIKALKAKCKESPSLEILVSTNSLASTDSVYAFAYSHKRRKKFIKDLKLQIFQFKPHPQDIKEMLSNFNMPLDYFPEKELAEEDIHIEKIIGKAKKRYLSIHAKSFVIDEEISWIGSFNLDPRSVNLNTEAGVIIRDKKFAQALKDNILRDMSPQNSWTLGKRKDPPLISKFSGFVGTMLDFTPIINIWPYRYSSLYELEEGKEQVPFFHENFYVNYKDVGSFPEVKLSNKQIQIILIKAFGSAFESLI